MWVWGCGRGFQLAQHSKCVTHKQHRQMQGSPAGKHAPTNTALSFTRDAVPVAYTLCCGHLSPAVSLFAACACLLLLCCCCCAVNGAANHRGALQHAVTVCLYFVPPHRIKPVGE